MTWLEKSSSIIENSRDVGVMLPAEVLRQVEELKENIIKDESAKFALGLPVKCKNCTIEEIAVLCVMQQNLSATQKFVACEIDKSERTVKSITARLTEQGIICRTKGKDRPYEIIEHTEPNI